MPSRIVRSPLVGSPPHYGPKFRNIDERGPNQRYSRFWIASGQKTTAPEAQNLWNRLAYLGDDRKSQESQARNDLRSLSNPPECPGATIQLPHSRAIGVQEHNERPAEWLDNRRGMRLSLLLLFALPHCSIRVRK
jgi:hypothetical protein